MKQDEFRAFDSYLLESAYFSISLNNLSNDFLIITGLTVDLTVQNKLKSD